MGCHFLLQGIFPNQGSKPHLLHCRLFTHWAFGEAPSIELFSRSVMFNSLWPPWTVARRAPLSVGFSRQQYQSVLSFPSPGDPPDPGMRVPTTIYAAFWSGNQEISTADSFNIKSHFLDLIFPPKIWEGSEVGLFLDSLPALQFWVQNLLETRHSPTKGAGQQNNGGNVRREIFNIIRD